MKVGVPSEIKVDEYRVAITPSGVRELTAHGHSVMIEKGAGEGSAIAGVAVEVVAVDGATFDGVAVNDLEGAVVGVSVGKGV